MIQNVIALAIVSVLILASFCKNTDTFLGHEKEAFG
jgi:hypothetical protein